MVVVVTGGRAGAGLVASPEGVVTLGEIFASAVRIGIVAGGEDRAEDVVEQGPSLLGAIGVASADITGADEDLFLGRGFRRGVGVQGQVRRGVKEKEEKGHEQEGSEPRYRDGARDLRCDFHQFSPPVAEGEARSRVQGWCPLPPRL